MKLRSLLIFLTLSYAVNLNAQQSLCDMNISEDELAFKNHEVLVYAASYTWGLINTDVGEGMLKVNKTRIYPPEFHIAGTARTYNFYDKFFKVRDFYEAKFELPQMRSVYFHRDVNEGNYKMKNTYHFDWDKNIVKASIVRKTNPPRNVDIKLNKCTSDILTAFYSLRNLDFSDAYVGKVYKLSFAIDDETFDIKCRFLGREQKKIKALKQKVNCLKFAVEVIAGEVFTGEENVIMWVSDDKNHIPLEVESPVKVGRIKARLIRYDNLKYPFNFAN